MRLWRKGKLVKLGESRTDKWDTYGNLVALYGV